MNIKPHVKARVNLKKNRLYITIIGNVNDKELRELYTEVRFCIADLKNGFEVVSDISNCNFMYINGLQIYKKIIDYIIANNAGEVIRVVENKNISSKQIFNLSRKIQSYSTAYVDNLNDAEYKLENFAKRKGLRFNVKPISFEYYYRDNKYITEILNISVSGCAAKCNDEQPEKGSLIQLLITFKEFSDLQFIFEIKAEVVRVENHFFAARFLDFNEEKRQELYKRIIYETSQV